MKLAPDIQSLSTFKRDTAKLIRQMRKTKEPMILTVNGKAALVVQDADGNSTSWKPKSEWKRLKEFGVVLKALRQSAVCQPTNSLLSSLPETNSRKTEDE